MIVASDHHDAITETRAKLTHKHARKPATSGKHDARSLLTRLFGEALERKAAEEGN